MADSKNEIGTSTSKENISNSITDVIGRTPLVKLRKVVRGTVAEVVVKLESQNPGNSVKDRIAYQMIKQAEMRGDVVPGITTIVEPTSGNTGIGLAMVCASLGYKLIVTMPETMSIERRVVLKAYGAKVVLTPASMGVKGALEKAYDIINTLEHAFMPQQFENPDNPQVHRYIFLCLYFCYHFPLPFENRHISDFCITSFLF
jgi:cysteine synthase A